MLVRCLAKACLPGLKSAGNTASGSGSGSQFRVPRVESTVSWLTVWPAVVMASSGSQVKHTAANCKLLQTASPATALAVLAVAAEAAMVAKLVQQLGGSNSSTDTVLQTHTLACIQTRKHAACEDRDRPATSPTSAPPTSAASAACSGCSKHVRKKFSAVAASIGTVRRCKANKVDR